MVYIKALAYYLPERIISNEELVQCYPEWSVDKISQKVGVHKRHISGDSETAGDMAEMAAKQLFKDYDINPTDIDFLLLCTQSPDYFLPSTSCVLQHRLGIPTSAGALDYNLGCSGCIYGLAVAKGLISAGIARNVLLITSETYTKYLHPSDKSNRAIFGDGAAACLISDEGFAEIGNFVLGTDGGGAEHLIVKTGASRQKQSTGRIVKDVEGHFWYDDFLYMNGGAVFNFTLDVVPNLMLQILEKNCMLQSEVNYYIFHQANKFMLNTLRKMCDIPSNLFYNDISETGNTVSSTIFIALKDAIDKGKVQKNMNLMLAGFGVGLSWGGVIIRM